MFFGADYYPEHWPEDRWPVDARLMKEAGFNIVRLAEFAWAQMEPSEGQFDFEWLERAMKILGDHGIRAVLGTPTASHPAWLDQKYPSVRMVNERKAVVNFGNRQHACFNAPEYRRASARITRAMAERFGKSDLVYGWQIDNEFGPYCYCDICQKGFHDWLEKRYGTLDGLNEAWGTAFWGHLYSSWDRIPLPWTPPGFPNPSLALDYKRFMSASYVSLEMEQIEIIRSLSDKPITHNFMGMWPEDLDYDAIAEPLDWISWDNYPLFGEGAPTAILCLGHDISRGYKRKNFWVMEQQSGATGWFELSPSPRPGQVRLYTYQAVAHGADGIVYFRWRPCRSGTEQYWHGILDHDGSTNRRYEEIKNVGAELAALAPKLEGTTVPAEVAIVNDYTSRWAWQIQPTNQQINYSREAEIYRKAFLEKSVPVDVIQSTDEFTRYKLAVVPLMYIIRPEVAQTMRSFVEQGGTLVVNYRTAAKYETSLMADEAIPAMLTDVFGARVAEYHSPLKEEANFIKGVSAGLPSEPSPVSAFLDVLEPRGAEVLAEYQGFADGQPAVTMNRFGKGLAVYIGTKPDQGFLNALINLLMEKSGVAMGPEPPEGVEIAIRRAEGRELVFMMNYTAESKTLSVPDGAKVVLGDAGGSQVTLEPYGVRLFER